ncbi:hypothetical protein [Corynebacterium fournieri]|uniref:hypothetical protein n=1 Tax=Corynebacterium fournieri TaxID=1852390 RepID=UPI000A2F4F59|nr:hypothetical protein [Corynebacterium fournieri]WJY98400.1 hypothetical protein CFOUR_10080 [Corynebacterium fournieri]
MTTEHEGLYTSIDTERATASSKDSADAANQNMDTLPLGEGVHTVEEAEHHDDTSRWNDGNLPNEETK